MTKAKTKAARRKSGKARVPVTDLDHRKPERAEPADRTALEARARVHNLTLEQAKNPMSATAIGRLALHKVIDQVQHDALHRMVLLHGQYQQAISAPNLPRQPKEGFTASTDQSYVEWCKTTIAAYVTAAKEIHRSGNFLIWDAFSRIALSDMDVPHLSDEIASCADILKAHFGMESGNGGRGVRKWSPGERAA
jgi:hypothetical protein